MLLLFLSWQSLQLLCEQRATCCAHSLGSILFVHISIVSEAPKEDLVSRWGFIGAKCLNKPADTKLLLQTVHVQSQFCYRSCAFHNLFTPAVLWPSPVVLGPSHTSVVIISRKPMLYHSVQSLFPEVLWSQHQPTLCLHPCIMLLP